MADMKDKLEAAGQGHLLRFWDELNDSERATLQGQIESLDLAECSRLADEYVRNYSPPLISADLEAPQVFPASSVASAASDYVVARQLGEEAIRDGKVAAFTVAGGQGTRLGYDGPKGAFPISPIRDATLFCLFAEYLRGVERRYGRAINWYIMTSPLNHEETVAHFAENQHYGLKPDRLMFFQQGSMPVFHPDGRIALADKGELALSPDGHGGSLRALRTSGALEQMRERGEEYISYFQVDNPLVHCIDPLFLGLHIRESSELSSKAVTKADDLERVGNFCICDGKLQVIEYSDLPESLATARNEDDTRKFNAGSIAIHIFDRAFVERLTAADATTRLPWHRAEKKVAVVGEDGAIVEPESPNVVKLEMFVFDAIPLARHAIVMYTDRSEEFSPVKNAEGNDSPAVARHDISRRGARWLELAGTSVPRQADGTPEHPVEISPEFALDPDDLREQLKNKSVETAQPVLLVES